MVTQEQHLMDVEADVNQLKGAYEHVATKADVALLKSDITRLEGKIDSDITRLEGKMDSNLARLEGKIDSDIGRLEGKMDSDLANLENRLTRWIAGGIGVVVIGIVANIFVQLLIN